MMTMRDEDEGQLVAIASPPAASAAREAEKAAVYL